MPTLVAVGSILAVVGGIYLYTQMAEMIKTLTTRPAVIKKDGKEVTSKSDQPVKNRESTKPVAPKSATYSGEKKDGMMDGQGTYTWPSGSQYEGEFKQDLINGQGSFTVAHNGATYTGEWKNNKHHGDGVYTHSDGTEYAGKWKNNKPWNVDVTNTRGQMAKYVKGTLAKMPSTIKE